MKQEELIQIMSDADKVYEELSSSISTCTMDIAYITHLIGRNPAQKVAGGVSQTTVFDALSIYDTDLEFLVSVLKRYFNEMEKACYEMEENQHLITREGNSANYFNELNCSISLAIDDFKGFMVKANKFNKEFDEYLKDNRVFDVEKIWNKIKENHKVVIEFGNIHIIPFHRQHSVLQLIGNKIIDFARKNKNF